MTLINSDIALLLSLRVDAEVQQAPDQRLDVVPLVVEVFPVFALLFDLKDFV